MTKPVPTKPERGYSFTDDQLANPNEPLSGPDVDGEFDRTNNPERVSK